MQLSDTTRAALSKVVEQFKSGDLSSIVAIARIQPEGDEMPSARWSLSNRVLAYMQTGALDCRGFKQWQNVGRWVKKGTRAAYILAPILVPYHDPESGEEHAVLKGFRAVPVFGVGDTEGRGLPTVDYKPVELPPLADVAKRLGIAITYQPLPPGRLGRCNLTGTTVDLGSHDAEVFFHELAHAAHARVEGDLKGGQHPHQETVAEFTAAVLMDLYGLGDRTGNCWDYVKCYADDPIQAILKALSTVEKVLTLLLAGE